MSTNACAKWQPVTPAMNNDFKVATFYETQQEWLKALFPQNPFLVQEGITNIFKEPKRMRVQEFGYCCQNVKCWLCKLSRNYNLHQHRYQGCTMDGNAFCVTKYLCNSRYLQKNIFQNRITPFLHLSIHG